MLAATGQKRRLARPLSIRSLTVAARTLKINIMCAMRCNTIACESIIGIVQPECERNYVYNEGLWDWLTIAAIAL